MLVAVWYVRMDGRSRFDADARGTWEPTHTSSTLVSTRNGVAAVTCSSAVYIPRLHFMLQPEASNSLIARLDLIEHLKLFRHSWNVEPIKCQP